MVRYHFPDLHKNSQTSSIKIIVDSDPLDLSDLKRMPDVHENVTAMLLDMPTDKDVPDHVTSLSCSNTSARQSRRARTSIGRWSAQPGGSGLNDYGPSRCVVTWRGSCTTEQRWSAPTPHGCGIATPRVQSGMKSVAIVINTTNRRATRSSARTVALRQRVELKAPLAATDGPAAHPEGKALEEPPSSGGMPSWRRRRERRSLR